MRRNLVRTIGLLVLVGLIMPVGMLLAAETNAPPAVATSTANWYDVEQASNLLHQMQDLSFKVRKEVARLQVQEIELNWRNQSARLARATADINTLGVDLARLDQMKNKLEPWQQSLIHKVTPQVHEMVYQMDAALKALRKHQNRYILAFTQYSQNINILYNKSNQMFGTIGTVTQYARAEQKMAELRQKTNKVSS